jgi:hypothetical protein
MLDHRERGGLSDWWRVDLPIRLLIQAAFSAV